MNRIRYSYYVVMVDYGNGPEEPMGLEAVVKPEHTRRKIVEMIAERQYHGPIKFVHHVDDLVVEDVTLEIMDEVETLTDAREAS